jgi:replicative superfamily II helicase
MDEMHALGALFNGYLLEILISKVLFLEHRVADYSAIVNKGQQAHQRPGTAPTPLQAGLLPVRIQLIAMSATVGNVSELAAWFGNSEPFISYYRPVVLFEKIVAGDQCCNRKGTVIVEKMPLRTYKDLPGR